MELCTPYMLVNILIFIAGLWILIKGSDIFIDSASDIARSYNVSELAIGLTLVSIGTSLPELASSALAAFEKQPEFIVGNIIGSNITNITMILGLALLIGGKMSFSKKLLTRDGAILMGIFIATVILTYSFTVEAKGISTSGLNWICGVLFLAGAVLYCVYLFRNSRSKLESEASEEPPQKPSILKSYMLLLLGLIMVLVGSKMMLDTVVWGAKALNISTLVISITIVAFGTSVPELAVTVAGAMKKRYEMAIGNVIGSCIFNILLIFGVGSIITPIPIPGIEGAINLGLMCFSGVLLLLCMTGKYLHRWHGIILFLIYLAFIGYNLRSVIKL